MIVVSYTATVGSLASVGRWRQWEAPGGPPVADVIAHGIWIFLG